MGPRVHRSGMRALLAGLMLAGFAWGSPAAAKDKPTDTEECKPDPDNPDTTNVLPWKKFAVNGTCIEISGSLGAVYQNQLQTSGDRVPAMTTRSGTVPSNVREVGTGSFNFRTDTTTKTALGDLTTVFDVLAQKTTDNSDIGTLMLNEGTVSLAGLTIGYTSSLMNFWSGDFQSSATAPQRTVGVVSYERPLTETFKLAIAVETGVPTTTPPAGQFITMYPEDPVLAARATYESDTLSLQLAGMMHELKFTSTNRLLSLLGRSADQKVFGWAVTTGATLSVPFVAEGDEISGQATYAVNASSYLGTSTDLSSMASLLPAPADTRGWSAVVSYHHVWSEQWETNVMASRLALDIEAPRASPSIRTNRYGANLIWQPVRGFKVGTELAYVDTTSAPNGTLGIVPGTSGQALVGYLFLTQNY